MMKHHNPLSMTRRQLRQCIKNGKLPKLLDRLFGQGQWSFDAREQLWIVEDTHYGGIGKEYFCINDKGDWFKARIPDGVMQ